MAQVITTDAGSVVAKHEKSKRTWWAIAIVHIQRLRQDWRIGFDADGVAQPVLRGELSRGSLGCGPLRYVGHGLRDKAELMQQRGVHPEDVAHDDLGVVDLLDPGRQ